MKNTIKTQELYNRLHQIGGCDAMPDSFADGWDKAIDEAISVVSDISTTYAIGDQITIPLEGFGEFTATVQKITENGVIFMFDDCVAKMPMNMANTNLGGFGASRLYKKLYDDILSAFPEEIRIRITDISIPSYGEMFGHDDFYEEYIEPDNDEQFELMKKHRNRVADYKDNYCWYWLKNTTKDSASNFACVSYYGNSDAFIASYSYGVRPVFTLSV